MPKVTFRDYLRGIPTKKRVAFKNQMVADLGCSMGSVMHWSSTNIVPQYVREYLHKMAPVDIVFDYTPFDKK